MRIIDRRTLVDRDGDEWAYLRDENGVPKFGLKMPGDTHHWPRETVARIYGPMQSPKLETVEVFDVDGGLFVAPTIQDALRYVLPKTVHTVILR